MAEQVKWRMSEFVRIANEVNAAVCVPLAEKVAANASDPHHPEGLFVKVYIDPRTGARDWAHARVVSHHPHAMTVEAKHGPLARALGGG